MPGKVRLAIRDREGEEAEDLSTFGKLSLKEETVMEDRLEVKKSRSKGHVR